MSDNVIAEWTERIVVNEMTLRETQIRALLQPKPRWLPRAVWRRIIARLIILEERSKA